MPLEPGYFQPLVSLGGLVSEYGRGREVIDHSLTLSVASDTVLGSNVKRLWALLHNGTGTDCWAQFGADAAADSGVYLPAGGGYLLINADQPWTGDVRAIAVAGTPTLAITECSIP